MANTAIHPISGKTIEFGGTVGNISRDRNGNYQIMVYGAAVIVPIEAAGQFVCAVDGDEQGIFPTREEAEAEANAWKENYPTSSVEVIEIEERWGTRAL